MTFASLDKEKGLPELPPAQGEEFPLPAWYRSVREVPIELLGIEDICKAARQQIHLDQIVPVALRILQSNPLAGENYDGELLSSLNRTPSEYWRSHTQDTLILRVILDRIQQLDAVTDDVLHDARELLRQIASEH